MFEARHVIEESVASLAAQRATGEQMAALAEVVAAMYASLGDPQQYLIHDIRFQRALAVA
jgi:GntR family transcriptional repressor for pyruvate dehydrogenase complex